MAKIKAPVSLDPVKVALARELLGGPTSSEVIDLAPRALHCRRA